MFDMRGIGFMAIIGCGALAGALLAAPVLVASIFFPTAIQLAWVPFVVCIGIGIIAGIAVERR